MALLPGTLEEALSNQAASQTAQTKDTYAQNRRRLVAGQAASGRLMSGVADYPLTDLDTAEAGDLSGIQTNLQDALAQVPAESILNQNQFKRQLDLAKYVGSLMQPSTLDEVFQGIGAATRIGGTAAGFGAFG